MDAIARPWEPPPGGLLSGAPLALLVALALIVGVNFANDYSDGIRGTDENRVGPLRLVGSGTAAHKPSRAGHSRRPRAGSNQSTEVPARPPVTSETRSVRHRPYRSASRR